MSLSRSRLPISVSAISESPLAFFEAVPTLEAQAKSFHVDVMDGHFVPRLGLYPEFIQEISGRTALPINIHLMAKRPESFIDDLVSCGASRISFHIESTDHPHRLVESIRSQGVEAGVAINPGTSHWLLDQLLEGISSVTIMAINPGIVGHKFIPSSIGKISELRRFLVGNTSDSVPEIEVDGGVTFENASKIISAGADTLVCGAGTIFAKQSSLAENLQQLQSVLKHP